MRKLSILTFIALCLTLVTINTGWAKVYHSVDKTYTAATEPLDIAVSGDGKYTFVLGPKGKVVIYVKDGDKEEISVDGDYDRIAASGEGDKIWVSNQKTKEIKEVFVDFIKTLTADGSPYLGDDKAPVVITLFADFQCPHCAQLGEMFPALLEKNPNKIKIVYKYYPLPNHQFAGAAAVAAWAAQQQGKFWQYHDLVYADFRDLNMQKFTQFAEKIGLNIPQFQQQMNSQEAKDKVIRDIQEGQAAGVTGTPAMFINGRMVRDRTEESIQKMIDEALKNK